MTTPTHDADCRGAATPPGESCCDQEHARWLAAPTPAPLTDADLDAMQRRADAATPGPWRTFPAKPGSPTPNDCAFGRAGVAFTRDELPCIGECWAETRRGVEDRMQAHANAEFIAHARTDVDALVAEVKRRGREYDAMCDRLRWLHDALMQAPVSVSDALGLPLGWPGWTDLADAIDEARRS